MSGDKIYVAGHNGMVGSAILRLLKEKGYTNIVVRNKSELDLTRQSDVERFMSTERPDIVYIASAKVGGIYANNTFPADFIYINLLIQANLMHSAFLNGVQKLLFLGSSCIYPRLAPQPIKESDLLSGPLEPTNEAYAIAKIAGIKLCESYSRQHGVDFRSIMPTNLYGFGDNYDLHTSHVVPALLYKIYKAKICNHDVVEIWGTGLPKREFLFVDDLASAAVFLLSLDKETYSRCTTPRQSFVNVGSGDELTIKELALKIAKIVGFDGALVFNSDKPDGAPRKILDSTKLTNLGWAPKITLDEGLLLAFNDMKSKFDKVNLEYLKA